MAIELRTLYLPLIFIALIIGYQISIYFFYQYYKFKEEKLHLNKIQISYSLFFGFSLTGILFRNINKYYIEDLFLSEIFLKITNCIFILSIVFFLYFVSSKTFNEILNSKLTKIAYLTMIIPFISVLIYPSGTLILNIILIIPLLGFLYMLIFQLKLISSSSGTIKTRFILLLIGELLLGGAMLLGGEFSRNLILGQIEELFFIIAIPLSIIAFMIILMGVQRFPAILEFEWKNCLLELFIVNQRNFEIIYEFNFTSISEDNINLIRTKSNSIKKEVFFSSGIFGIEDIISGIINWDEGRIEKIRHGDLIIFLNQGDDPLSFIIYCLLVNKELNSYEYFLKKIKNQFQNTYKNVLLKIDTIVNIKRIIKSFDNTIKRIIK